MNLDLDLDLVNFPGRLTLRGNWGHFENERVQSLTHLEIDVCDLEKALRRKDYRSILEDPERFWALYSLVLVQSGVGSAPACYCSFRREGDRVILSQRIIQRVDRSFEAGINQLKTVVEEMRKMLAEAHGSHENVSFLFVDTGISFHIVKDTALVDVRKGSGNEDKAIVDSWVHSYLFPCLSNLCDAIGATCLRTQVDRRVTYFSSTDSLKKVERVLVDWNETDHLTYPIPPKAIPEREKTHDLLYSMYQNKTITDFSLVAKEGELEIHKPILFAFGGEALQLMLTSSFAEATQKKLDLTEFSLPTVKVFADFLYLGEKALEARALMEKEVDMLELFELAHFYQIESLIDCCTNCLCLMASSKDLETIEFLAEKYDNAHLKELHAYLKQRASGAVPLRI